MRCSNCGNIVGGNSKFCDKCGAKINATQVMPANKNNNVIILLASVLGIVLISLVVVLFILVKPSGQKMVPEENVKTTIVREVIVPTQAPAPTPIPTPVPAPVQSEETIRSVMYVVKCNEYITLRRTPSTAAAAITRIPLGDSVGYISTASNGFYKVSYNGDVGYALAAYLSNEPYYEPQMTSPYMTVVNCDEWISLRKSPSKSADRIVKIPLGAQVEFISTAANGFYYVKYAGCTGYALAEYLR